MVHGWRDTVNRWEAINFGLECPHSASFRSMQIYTQRQPPSVLFVLFRPRKPELGNERGALSAIIPFFS